jgi:hypothetical protein
MQKGVAEWSPDERLRLITRHPALWEMGVYTGRVSVWTGKALYDEGGEFRTRFQKQVREI